MQQQENTMHHDLGTWLASHVSANQSAGAAIGGGAIAVYASVSVDPNWTAWLQVGALIFGCLSGLSGFLVGIMKLRQQRLEMRFWRRDHPE